MKLNDLHPNPGSKRKRRRIGRGVSAGQGKFAGRGRKGQHARPGGTKGPYFEGGQLPLVRRLPFKRGFTNVFRIEYQEVSVIKLAKTFKAGGDVTPKELAAANLISDADKPVVILGDGDIKAKLNVSVHRITKSARAKIEEAGGKVTIVPLALKGALATVKLLPKDRRPK